MSERNAAMKRYREWQSGHWSGDKPEWDEVHGATEDAWLAAEQARADLAAEEKRVLREALNRLHAASVEYRRCCEKYGVDDFNTIRFCEEVYKAEAMSDEALAQTEPEE